MAPRGHGAPFVGAVGGWHRGSVQAGNGSLDPVQKSDAIVSAGAKDWGLGKKQYLRGNGGGCMRSEL